MAIEYTSQEAGLVNKKAEGGAYVNESEAEYAIARTAANDAAESAADAEAAQLAAEAAQAAAELAETNAETAETNAETAETNAAASASAASTSETNAATSASNAATSETNAATSETNAATSETNSATSETNAAASASAASSSATDAATAETGAETAQTAAEAAQLAAETAETNAEASATAAATSETNAATSETNAATSETNAATSESNAATSASSALSSANAAATSETNAATSETNAAASETAALAAQSAAETARDSALAAYDDFDDRYLGAKASDPSVDNDGNALVAGALYFNTSDETMKLYTGSNWVAAYVSADGTLLVANNLSDLNNVASALVNLGLSPSDDVEFNSVQLAGGTGTQGTLSWNTDEETADLILDGATLQLGQEIHYHVRNNSGSTISNGSAVYATGTLGASGRITVSPFIADGTIAVKFFLGIATEDIADGADGKVTDFGKVRSIDTSAFSDGDVLYPSASTAGALTNTAPTGSNLAIPCAFVIHAASNGTISVRVHPQDENAYATAAQGTLADTAYGWGDHAAAGYVDTTASTGSAEIPTGTEAQRDGTPAAGYFRFNTDTTQFEGYNGTEWGAIAGGGSSVILENAIVISEEYLITDGYNGVSGGPVVVETGGSVSVPTGSIWTII